MASRSTVRKDKAARVSVQPKLRRATFSERANPRRPRIKTINQTRRRLNDPQIRGLNELMKSHTQGNWVRMLVAFGGSIGSAAFGMPLDRGSRMQVRAVQPTSGMISLGSPYGPVSGGAGGTPASGGPRGVDRSRATEVLVHPTSGLIGMGLPFGNSFGPRQRNPIQETSGQFRKTVHRSAIAIFI